MFCYLGFVPHGNRRTCIANASCFHILYMLVYIIYTLTTLVFSYLIILGHMAIPKYFNNICTSTTLLAHMVLYLRDTWWNGIQPFAPPGDPSASSSIVLGN